MTVLRKIPIETLRQDAQVYSRKDLAIKYACNEGVLSRFLTAWRVGVPRFTPEHALFIHENYKWVSDAGLARSVGTLKDLVTSFRLRNWLLHEREWNEERVHVALQRMVSSGRCVSPDILRADHPELHKAAARSHGSLENAYRNVGIDVQKHIDLHEVISARFPTAESILGAIKAIHRDHRTLNFTFARQFDPALVAAALIKQNFSSWSGALAAAGLLEETPTLNAATEQLRGIYFETLVREVFRVVGRPLGKLPAVENPEGFRPDFYEPETKTWIDAKLRPWSEGVEATLENYLRSAAQVEIVCLEDQEWVEAERIQKHLRVKFLKIEDYFPELERNGRVDLISELHALRPSEPRSGKFIEFLQKHRAFFNQEPASQKTGAVGTIKPTVFLHPDGSADYNRSVTREDLGIPRSLYSEFFKSFAVCLAERIYEMNPEFFGNGTDKVLKRIDAEEFRSHALAAKEFKKMYKAETVKSFAARMTLSYQKRIYRLGFFLRDAEARADSFKQKKAVLQTIQRLIEAEEAKALSDAQLQEVLKQQGIRIARRTVAKYRAMIGIAASTARGKRVERL